MTLRDMMEMVAAWIVASNVLIAIVNGAEWWMS